ncbi:MAG: DNA polymerase III subunit gamma/tau, partial [Herbaspirillum sp.]
AQTAQIAAELDWDGDWRQLASDLPLRGMAAQMTRQSELICCARHGNTVYFHIRIPVDTLRAAGNIEKLSTVLSERFHIPIRVETEIGAVALTANAKAEENRAAQQREAELTMQNDPFVQVMMREFDASIVPGSIRIL